ncbi:MAG: M20/M25/M40 family metallo-hydrolase [Lachnospiraceae bacterium]|nr:M20/M25/M40 family metallo-hydrolase [Lachnospiraceae bacterium]
MIQEKRLLDLFLELVQIDSESCNEKAMGERLVKECEALGLEVRTDRAGETFGSNGFNVFAKLPGSLPGEPFVMSAHMDTVKPGNGIKPFVEDGVIKSGPDTILGGDDKSGIAGILEAVRTVLENNLPHREAEIVFSIGEEGGMRGVKAFDVSQLKSRRAYVFDSSGNVGKVIVGAPGQVKVNATVIGRRAHAGLAPEEGISAIQVMAKAIAKMNLLRIDEETTCNIGTIKAEYATNIVPDRCSINAEVRSRNLDKLKAQAAHIRSCLEETCAEFGAQLECDTPTNYESYRIPDDAQILTEVLSAIDRVGAERNVTLGGGGSDANIYNQKGIQAVVLGTGMTKVHTTEETITVENLNNTAKLAFELLTH